MTLTAQYRAWRAIADHGPLTVRDLAAATKIDHIYCKSIVRRLVFYGNVGAIKARPQLLISLREPVKGDGRGLANGCKRGRAKGPKASAKNKERERLFRPNAKFLLGYYWRKASPAQTGEESIA